jgi:hypothetical protein
MVKLLVPIIALAAVAAMPFAAPAADAARGEESSGTLEVTASEVLDETTIGNMTVFHIHNTIVLTGTFEGTLDCDEVQFVKPSGKAKFFDACEFTGTVDGVSGTASLFAAGRVDEDGSFKGTSFTTDGTGDLAGIFSPGRFEGVEGVGTYSGRLFLPDGDVD